MTTIVIDPGTRIEGYVGIEHVISSDVVQSGRPQESPLGFRGRLRGRPRPRSRAP
jgi:Ni,Fe-hydrogenase I large subunit